MGRPTQTGPDEATANLWWDAHPNEGVAALLAAVAPSGQSEPEAKAWHRRAEYLRGKWKKGRIVQPTRDQLIDAAMREVDEGPPRPASSASRDDAIPGAVELAAMMVRKLQRALEGAGERNVASIASQLTKSYEAYQRALASEAANNPHLTDEEIREAIREQARSCSLPHLEVAVEVWAQRVGVSLSEVA